MIGAGALLGLLAGLGALLVVTRLPMLRRVRLADRVAPPVVVIGTGRGALSRRSLLSAAAGRLDRFVGGRAALARRLDRCGAALSVEQYRVSQVLWAAGGALPGAGLLALGGVSARPSVSLAGAALVIAGVAGSGGPRRVALPRHQGARGGHAHAIACGC